MVVKKSIPPSSHFIAVISFKLPPPHTHTHTVTCTHIHTKWWQCFLGDVLCEVRELRPLSAVQSSPLLFLHNTSLHHHHLLFFSSCHPPFIAFVFSHFYFLKTKYIKYRENFIIKRVLHECMFTREIMWKIKKDDLSKTKKKATCKDNLRTLFVETPSYKGQWTGLRL